MLAIQRGIRLESPPLWRNQNSHRVGYHINLVCIFISFYSIEKQPSELTASMMSPVNPSLSLSPLWTVSLSLSPSFNGMQNPPASGTWGQCSRFCLNDLEIELVFKTHLTSLQASISREGGHHLSFGSSKLASLFPVSPNLHQTSLIN